MCALTARQTNVTALEKKGTQVAQQTSVFLKKKEFKNKIVTLVHDIENSVCQQQQIQNVT